jgi:hypothetical protein
VQPSLPYGLLFSDEDGTISGVPLGHYESHVHVVTAQNAAGSASIEIEIEVLSGANQHRFV